MSALDRAIEALKQWEADKKYPPVDYSGRSKQRAKKAADHAARRANDRARR